MFLVGVARPVALVRRLFATWPGKKRRKSVVFKAPFPLDAQKVKASLSKYGKVTSLAYFDDPETFQARFASSYVAANLLRRQTVKVDGVKTQTSAYRVVQGPDEVARTVRLVTNPSLPYELVKNTLVEYGTLQTLVHRIPKHPQCYIVTYTTKDGADNLIKHGRTNSFLRVDENNRPAIVTRVGTARKMSSHPPRDTVTSPKRHIAIHEVPVHLGATSDSVWDLVSEFGHTSLIHVLFNGQLTRSAIASFPDIPAAAEFLDAIWTDPGLFIRGERVYANYIRTTKIAPSPNITYRPIVKGDNQPSPSPEPPHPPASE